MPSAWRNLCLTAMILALTSCSQVSNTDTSEVSNVDTTSASVELDINYKELSFKNLPEDINSELELGDEFTNVVMTGYLSSSISNDKSTGYLFNSGYGTTPDATNFGKCIVLDLSSASMGDAIAGDSFVEVKGTLVREPWTDIYNLKSMWHLKVNSIENLLTLPANVQEYQDYMDSHEFEAFAKMIDYVGTAVYAWYEDETVTELDLEDIGCDTEELSTNTSEKYPELYKVIKDYEENLINYYHDIVDLIEKGERPTDIQVYYDGLYKNYAGLSDSLVGYGMINNGD